MLIASVAGNVMSEHERLLTDIYGFLQTFEQAVDAGYDSKEGQDFRALLRSEILMPTPEQALDMLPWAEALCAHLREKASQAKAPPENYEDEDEEPGWDCGKGGHRFMGPQDEHCNVCNDWVGAVEP
jgi:hypothetical protein